MEDTYGIQSRIGSIIVVERWYCSRGSPVFTDRNIHHDSYRINICLLYTSVIDWYSRCIVGWEVDDTLDTRMVITALKKAFKVAKPQILNSDQGCQFTSQQYIDFVKENGIRQSMDGKSRWADNIMIERWFRSFKYEEAYLTQYNNIREARSAIGKYIHTYNFERRHSALEYQTPAECYYPAMLLPYVA